MNKYSNAKIYEIVNVFTPEEIEAGAKVLRYIGATICPLVKRVTTHKSEARRGTNQCRAHLVIENGPFEANILELYPCKDRDELTTREAHYIRTLECVNKNVPARSPEEKKAIIDARNAKNRPKRTAKVNCPVCAKLLSSSYIDRHIIAQHSSKPAPIESAESTDLGRPVELSF